jgi:hypothetical protein
MPEMRVLSGAQKGHTFFLRPPGPYTFGRDLEADYPLFDRRASRRHFRVDFLDLGYHLVDLGSRSGTFVNDVRAKGVLLGSEARIVAGGTTFIFALDAPTDALIGREIGGYRITERVGSGGAGVVYRAVQTSLGRVVALKVLPQELARDEEFCRMFVAEARSAAELSHPNIVRVYDVNLVDGVLFYAMEYMAQGSVEDLCRRRGPLPLSRALEITLSAALGLQFAETHGIVHRDIKPANLLVDQSGAVKIADLGIATRVQSEGRGGPSRPVGGSPHYMAPEQALSRPVDARTDLYALGASLYQVLAGRPPFVGETVKDVLVAQVRQKPEDIESLRPDVPETVGNLLRRLLEKDPAKRPASAGLVADAVRDLIDAMEPEAPRDSPPWVRRWTRRSALGLLAGGAFIAGRIAGAIVGDLRRQMKDRASTIAMVRGLLEEGRKAIGAGDLDRAALLGERTSGLQLSPSDWDMLRAEIGAFERALRAARGTDR